MANTTTAPLTWFLVTVDRTHGNFAHVLLVQGRSGADVEDALKRHGYDQPGASIGWTPLDLAGARTIMATTVLVIPAGAA